MNEHLFPLDRAPQFWSRIRKTDGCWPWQGYRSSEGYGRTSFRIHPCRYTVNAARLALYLARGDLGAFHVLHHCDNPICCNPSHLYLGTPDQNTRDRVMRKRSSPSRKVTSAYPYANFITKGGRWAARISWNKKAMYLGSFATAAEASAVARKRRSELGLPI